MGITWLAKDDLFSTISKKLAHVDVVLDIGCGIKPQEYVRPLVHICCEPCEQYVEQLQEKIKYEYDRNFVLLKTTWAEAVQLFPPRSVDTVFLVDVIEHVEKEEAIRLLNATETLARKQIAVFTPLGFLPQGHSDGKDGWGLSGGAWQEHRSGWEPEDFDDSWDIYAAKMFHTKDGLGRELERPYGALWAIKNMDEVKVEDREFSFEKERIHSLVDTVLDRSPDAFFKLFVFLMKIVHWVRASKSG